MRILLVSHKYPPHALGGVEVYTHNLAQALQARHQVAVFFRHDEPQAVPFAFEDREEDGLLVRQVSCKPKGLAASVAGEFFGTFLNRSIEDSFSQFVRLFRPDLIHVQHVMALSARLLPLAAQTGLPVVLTLHDYWFLCANSQLIWPDGQICQGKAGGMNCVRCAAAARFPSPLVRWLRPGLAPLFLIRDRIVGEAARQAHWFISPSRFLIDRYVQAGFPADRFSYLENGIRTDRIQSVAWQPRQGPLRVTFLGSLAWQKGAHVLAEAFAGLPEGAARLRIWGDPALFPDYVQRVQALLPPTGAELMGRVPNEWVGQVLADSDVVVVPSLWYENSPVVIQEARAAGVPVVTSGHGALAEKVRDGVDGLHFAPGDAQALQRVLQRLLDEPELLPALRAGIAEPTDMGDHVRQLETEYYRMISR